MNILFKILKKTNQIGKNKLSTNVFKWLINLWTGDGVLKAIDNFICVL